MIVDISQFQGTIDWDALGSTNPEAVIIRAGFGVGGRDTQFNRNWQEAKNRGIKRIAYWFCYPAYNTAQAEAAAFNSVVGLPLAADEGMAGDFENDPGAQPWPQNAYSWGEEFLSLVGGPNYIPGFYGAPSFLQSHSLAGLADTWWMWIADWAVQTPNTLGKKASLWQFTDCASIAGVSGCVDASYPLVPIDSLLAGRYTGGTDISLDPTDAIVQELRYGIARIVYLLANGQQTAATFDANGNVTYTPEPSWPNWIAAQFGADQAATTAIVADVKAAVSNLQVPPADLQPVTEALAKLSAHLGVGTA